jgi:hypothetical protein
MTRKGRNRPKKVKRKAKSAGFVRSTPEAPSPDTASEIVEIYESVERSYRAAMMAGETFAGVAQSTNY